MRGALAARIDGAAMRGHKVGEGEGAIVSHLERSYARLAIVLGSGIRPVVVGNNNIFTQFVDVHRVDPIRNRGVRSGCQLASNLVDRVAEDLVGVG